MKKIAILITILLTCIIASNSHSYTPSSYSLIKKVLDQFDFENPIFIEQNIYKEEEEPVAGSDAEETAVPEETAKADDTEETVESAETAEPAEEANDDEVSEDAAEEEVTKKDVFSKTFAYIKYPAALNISLTTGAVPGSGDEGDENGEAATNISRTIKLIINDDNVIEMFDDSIISFRRNNALYFYELFAYNDVEAFLLYLDAIDIDSTKVTMGLNDKKVCYVIGADQINDRVNQLWIDKESSLPVRLVLFYKEGERELSDTYEFLEYDKAQGLYFPSSIKYHSGALDLDFDYVTTKITRTAIDNDDMFDVKGIVKSRGLTLPDATAKE